jgi:hypothetical protein
MTSSEQALERIRALKAEDPAATLDRIAATLNEQQIPSPSGRHWTPPTVSTVARKGGIDVGRPTFSGRALERILDLKEADSSIGLAAIGETLTSEGILTPQGGKWWPATVRKALQAEADAGNERAKAALARRGERQLGEYQGKRSVDPYVLARIVSFRFPANGTKPMALHEIADLLTSEGVPTTRGGRRWWQSTVRSALNSGGYDA